MISLVMLEKFFYFVNFFHTDLKDFEDCYAASGYVAIAA